MTMRDEASPVAELRRIDLTGTIWFAAGLVAAATVVAALMLAGWRPAQLPVGAAVAWWAGAALVVEVALAAGLVAEGTEPDGSPAWLPTDEFDVWSGRPMSERWARLVGGWLAIGDMTTTTNDVTTGDFEGQMTPACWESSDGVAWTRHDGGPANTSRLVRARSSYVALQDPSMTGGDLVVWQGSDQCSWEQTLVGKVSPEASGLQPITASLDDSVTVVVPLPGAPQVWVGRQG